MIYYVLSCFKPLLMDCFKELIRFGMKTTKYAAKLYHFIFKIMALLCIVFINKSVLKSPTAKSLC